MKTHTFARLFPVITGPDFDDMVADIKANGLREKITTLGGMILDGQNRYLACEAAGVAPKYEAYEGPDPLSFVVSKNMARRHLTDDQRAAIAAEIAKAKPGKQSNLDPLKLEPTIEDAATMLKVSENKVKKAKAVKRESPKAFKKVKEGKLSLNAAHEQTHPRKAKEKEASTPIYTCDPKTGEVTTEKESQFDVALLAGQDRNVFSENYPPDATMHSAETVTDGERSSLTGQFGAINSSEANRLFVEKLRKANPENPVLNPVKKPITLHQFDSRMVDLEREVNEACAGNQAERARFGVVANAMAGRLMNPPQARGIYTR